MISFDLTVIFHNVKKIENERDLENYKDMKPNKKQLKAVKSLL
jgi:hypothetical protein